MKLFKKIWNFITTVTVVFVVLLTAGLVGVRLVGIRPFTVLSGSMEPTYHVGSVIYVKKADTQHLRPGDAITFLLDEDTVVTHRIIEVLQDEEDPSVVRYRTQGDANDSADGTAVHYKNILGVPVFTIPYLGYVSDYVSNPPGRYYAISAAAIIVLLTFLPDLFDDGEDEEEPKRPKKKKARAVNAKEEPDDSRRETARRREAPGAERPGRKEGCPAAAAQGKGPAHSTVAEHRVQTAGGGRTAAADQEPVRQREYPARETEKENAEEFDFDAFLASLEEELK